MTRYTRHANEYLVVLVVTWATLLIVAWLLSHFGLV